MWSGLRAAAANRSRRTDQEPWAKRWVLVPQGIDPAPYVAAADRIAAGTLTVFSVSCANGASPPRWNCDPKTGAEAPLTPGKLLDYRDRRLVGDIKYLWEVNRHLQLVTLAQGYALTREAKYLRVLQQHLESWIRACPYGRVRTGAARARGGDQTDQLVHRLAASARRCGVRQILRRHR